MGGKNREWRAIRQKKPGIFEKSSDRVSRQAGFSAVHCCCPATDLNSGQP
jgi:hypothetical protein